MLRELLKSSLLKPRVTTPSTARGARQSSALAPLKQRPFPPWQRAFDVVALQQAWLNIKANKGTAGVDRQTVAEFDAKQTQLLHKLEQKLKTQTYRPQRVRQVLVPKQNGDWRPLTIWTLQDRIAQRATKNYLDPVVDPQFCANSFGFRAGKGTSDVAQYIELQLRNGRHWIFDADIKDCFGSMRSAQVSKQLVAFHVPGPIRQLVQQWLQVNIPNGWGGKYRKAGTSQGSPLSPLLCNLYLHSLDEACAAQPWSLVRYADDFLVLANSKRQVKHAATFIEQELAQLGLQLHPQKTRTTHVRDGVQFVGWFFNGQQAYQLK